MPFKWCLAQLHDARLVKEKAKKEKIKQLLPTV